MDTIECIKTRRSIRGFKPDTVPKDVLEDIISIAKQSPSYKNTQPWEVIILSGEKKKVLSNLLVDLLAKDEPTTPDFPEPISWPEAQLKRIDHLYKKRSAATGLDLTDPALIKKSKKSKF